jgi:hypothetical protein
MSSRYGVLCFFLFVVVLLLAYKNYETWSQSLEWLPKKEGAKKSEVKPESPSGMEFAKGPYPRESIQMIAEKNIFNPERKEFPLLSAEQTKTGMVRPQIILYGVAIASDYQTASVVNPGRPLHKGERELMTLKLGDRIGDYKVTEILSDRITVEAAGDSFEVLLFDPKSPKKRTEIKTPSKPAEVTSTLPTPTLVPGPAPAPAPTPAIPGPISPQVVPRSPVPMQQKGIESQPPRTVTPAPVPDPGIWRGRRPITPGVPSDSGGNY